ncbi:MULTISPECIES: ROK family protein [unclassified Schaalia]|uniref:ROK family protein n=1 Tax=unclassified Schaalia TaxID=2691889 RepID=UPI001E484FC0|nr:MULTISPECIES: ROK family protein [unclassified Schaalia]MCD4549261.1 ROK family protein [Schaalia sp. lx-260]MCD4557070.1 ROK family protein [Schaalia sp. lx-100]
MALLSIDIGGTKIRAGLVEGDQVQETVTFPTEAHKGAQHVLSVVVRASEVLSGYDGIGVACAGVVSEGKVISATSLLPGWAGTDVAGALREASGVKVTVLGDVHAHGMGEALCGAGRGYSSCLTVAVGTGIGGAFIDNGCIQRGAHALAGHIGHISTSYAEGLECSCGRSGHVEPLASGSGVMDRYEALTGERCDGREIDRRAQAGEQNAVDVLYGSARGLGEVLGSVANVMDPAVFVLSGSMTRSGKGWWDSLAQGYASSAMNLVRETPIVLGTLGDDAPLIGAAMQWRKEWQ